MPGLEFDKITPQGNLRLLFQRLKSTLCRTIIAAEEINRSRGVERKTHASHATGKAQLFVFAIEPGANHSLIPPLKRRRQTVRRRQVAGKDNEHFSDKA